MLIIIFIIGQKTNIRGFLVRQHSNGVHEPKACKRLIWYVIAMQM